MKSLEILEILGILGSLAPLGLGAPAPWPSSRGACDQSQPWRLANQSQLARCPESLPAGGLDSKPGNYEVLGTRLFL